MISAIYIFNHKGDVLISRVYRPSDIKIHVIANPASVRSPVNTHSQQTFLHLRSENLFIVAVSANETCSSTNVALIFEFLHKLVSIGCAYFDKFDEESIKSNFVLVYELLDEILDYGWPQTCDVEALKMYIMTESIRRLEMIKQPDAMSKVTIQTTGATSWRRPDIKYRKNECYLDVVESVNMLMSAKGAVLKSDVSGQIVMRTYLSGMPDCKLGLNDKVLMERSGLQNDTTRRSVPRTAKGSGVELDDVQFHQCVKLGKFDAERTISFVPPDGEFELMRYRTTDNINLPFKVTPVVNEMKTKVEYKVSVKALFNATLVGQSVVIRIPTPPNCAKATITVPIGRAKYASGENCIVWKIQRFQGDEEHILSAEAELSSMVNKKTWSRPPVTMEFQVMMFTSSGLNVTFLKVFEKSNYKSVKWVRYFTKAGSYQFRF